MVPGPKILARAAGRGAPSWAAPCSSQPAYHSLARRRKSHASSATRARLSRPLRARHSALLAGASRRLAPVLQWSRSVNDSVRPRSPIRVAFVGAGRMARLHLHALRRVSTPHIVVAVCDATEDAAFAFAALTAGALPYKQLPDLL